MFLEKPQRIFAEPSCDHALEKILFEEPVDRKSTRLNSSHDQISYAVFCLKKKKTACTASYGQFQQPALTHEPLYQVRGALTDDFDCTVSSMRTLFPGARLGLCLRHALNKLPDKLIGVSASVRQGLRSQFHALLHRGRQRSSLRVVALGQRLRRFADAIATTVGPDHGECVRRWFQAKKAGWYKVLADPQM